jgi:hypothetical protein
MDYNSINFKNGVIDRLDRKANRVAVRANKSVDKGNQAKTDKLYKKAGELQDRQMMKSYSKEIKRLSK